MNLQLTLGGTDGVRYRYLAGAVSVVSARTKLESVLAQCAGALSSFVGVA